MRTYLDPEQGDTLRSRFSATQIKQKVEELATQISYDYQGLDLTLCIVLNGAFIFAADLIRHLQNDDLFYHVDVKFVVAESYNADKRQEVIIHNPPLVWNRNVLIIEDIVDSGFTVSALQKKLFTQKPESLRLCTLLWKSSGTKKRVKIDYYGFDVPDKWVVGYGMDFDGKYRNLPSIYDLEGQPATEGL